jgi:hypothetical protein
VVVVHIEFWWGNLRERDQLELLGADGRIILNWILKEFLECGIYGDGAHRVCVGKLERKRPPGITRNRWHDNIKIDHKERFWNVASGMVPIELWWGNLRERDHLE